jgi:hypothetical protein
MSPEDTAMSGGANQGPTNPEPQTQAPANQAPQIPAQPDNNQRRQWALDLAPIFQQTGLHQIYYWLNNDSSVLFSEDTSNFRTSITDTPTTDAQQNTLTILNQILHYMNHHL